MTINVEREFEATLSARAAARNQSVLAYVKHLICTDPTPIPILEENAQVLVNSLRMDHGEAAGHGYFLRLQLVDMPQIEELICARPIAEGISPADYLRRRVAADV